MIYDKSEHAAGYTIGPDGGAAATSHLIMGICK
jgi:hypothetical protein